MSPYLDSEQVILKLKNLKEYINILKKLQKISLKEIENDPIKTGALLHYLQLCAEISIDIGQMIISAESWEQPMDSVTIFLILHKEKILSKNLATNFAAVARFRNLIVHEYAKVDMKKVHNYLKKELHQFENYSKAIAKYLSKR